MSKNLVYMGSSDFAVGPLLALVEAGYLISAVFTQPDKPAGRGRVLSPPPVKVAAERLCLPIAQPLTLRDKSVQEHLQNLQPEIIVVAAYAQLLPPSVLRIPANGCLNIHASLLPRYRGGAPVHWAIMNGEHETGVTIMHMASGLDTGDILLQEKLPIEGEATAGDITALLSSLGAKLILDILALPDRGEGLRTPQQHALATYARNIRKEDGKLPWHLESAAIHNLIRGLNPWPLAYTSFAGQYLRISRSRMATGTISLGPGEVRAVGSALLVGTGKGLLELLELQPAGKRVMTGIEFARGYLKGSARSFQLS